MDHNARRVVTSFGRKSSGATPQTVDSEELIRLCLASIFATSFAKATASQESFDATSRRDPPSLILVSSSFGVASRWLREKSAFAWLRRDRQDRHHFIVFQHAHQASSNFGLRLLIFRKVPSARTLCPKPHSSPCCSTFNLPFGRNVIVILQSPASSGTNTAVSFSIVASPDASPTFAAGPAPDLYS